MGFDKKSWEIYFVSIFLIIITYLLFISYLVYAQDENNQTGLNKESGLWFAGILNFFKSLFNAIFQINSNIAENTSDNTSENLSGSEEINLSEDFKTTANGTRVEGNLTIGISNITNISCGFCQYLMGNSCLNYSCCKDEDCDEGRVCSQNKCFKVNENINFYFYGVSQRESHSGAEPRLYPSTLQDNVNFNGYVITPTFCNNLTAKGYLLEKNIFLEISIDDNDCGKFGKLEKEYNSPKRTWFSGRYENLGEGDYYLILIVNGLELVNYSVKILGKASNESVNIPFETLQLEDSWESAEYTGPLISGGFYLIANGSELQRVYGGLNPKPPEFTDLKNYFLILVYMGDSCGPVYPKINSITQSRDKIYIQFSRQGSCKDVGDEGWHIVKIKRADLVKRDNVSFIFILENSEKGVIKTASL